jgi:hypothetical protein
MSLQLHLRYRRERRYREALSIAKLMWRRWHGQINTNIAGGACNRPDHMGGPQVHANEEAVLAQRLATTGLDLKRVGERVLSAPCRPISSKTATVALRKP